MAVSLVVPAYGAIAHEAIQKLIEWEWCTVLTAQKIASELFFESSK
jgi:hypothetical protein